MLSADLKEILETLETFILLKRQNVLIFAWIQLKKNFRRAGPSSTLSPHSSRHSSQQALSNGASEGGSRVSYVSAHYQGRNRGYQTATYSQASRN